MSGFLVLTLLRNQVTAITICRVSGDQFDSSKEEFGRGRLVLRGTEKNRLLRIKLYYR